MSHRCYLLTARRMGLFTLLLAVLAYGQAQPAQTPTALPAQPTTATPATNPQNPPSDITAKDMEMARIVEDAYRDQVSGFRWAMGILMTVVLAAIGYAAFKSRQEYKQAVEEAEKASRDAHAACKEARSWEGKMAELYREQRKYVDDSRKELDAKVEKQLAEIQSKGEAKIKELIQKAKDEREEMEKQAKEAKNIIELWGKITRTYNDKRYDECLEALSSLAKIINITAELYLLWGNVLTIKATELDIEKAEPLFSYAYNKYEQAVKLNQTSPDIWKFWGIAMIYQAKHYEGQQRKDLLRQAEGILLEAEKRKRGAGAYNLACLHAIKRDEQKCKEWLLVGEAEKTLPTREDALTDPDLAAMRDKDWFQTIKWKGE